MVSRNGCHRRPTEETIITAYAIAHLEDVRLGPEIIDYIKRIDGTLAPYEGRFMIHAATP